MSKKEGRIESKKRKAAAFLRLVNEEETMKKVKAENDETSEEEKEEEKKDKSQIIELENDQETNKSGTSQSGVDMSLQTAAQMAEDELAQLRKALRERQKSSMQKPKVYLTLEELAYENGRLISKENTEPHLPPIFILDLQHLLLFGIQGNKCSMKPRWCQLLRTGKVSSVVVMVLDSVSSTEIQKYPECFKRLLSEFGTSVDMVSPSQYGSSVPEDLFYVPISQRQMKSLNVLEWKRRKKLAKTSKNPFPTGLEEAKQITSLYENDKFPRTCLLLNTNQMLREGFPLPVDYKEGKYKHFVYTKDRYKMVTSMSPMFAVDCEMCLTTANKSELTRVSIVNEKHESVYETFVKPFNKITNYLTRYSGITKQVLDPVTTRLPDVHRDIRKILPPDAILCGHSLNSDLVALQMFHPYVIDTSVVYNLSGVRHIKAGLRRLSLMFLGENIQESEQGHDSVEDAIASLQLVQLKLSRGIEFGDVMMGALMMSTTNPDIPSQSDKEGNTSTSQDLSSSDIDGTTAKSDNIQSGDIDMTESESQMVKYDQHKQSGENMTNSDTNSTSINSEKTSDKSSNDADSGQKCSDTGSVSGAKFLQPFKNDIVERRRAFFQRDGEFFYQSFFKVVRESCKTVALLAEKEIVDRFNKEDILAMKADSDKTSKSLTKSYVQYHDFVYSTFPSFKQCLYGEDKSEEAIKKSLKKLDKKVWKVLQSIRQNALVAVVLSGRSEDGTEHGAKTFLKIT